MAEDTNDCIGLSLVLGGLALVFIYVYDTLIWKTKRLRSKLRKQGIMDPPPSFMLGNIPDMKRIQMKKIQQTAKAAVTEHHKDDDLLLSHDWPSLLFPYLEEWRKEYGPIFVYSAGSIQFLSITDVDMVKELNLCTSLSLGKPSYLSKDRGPLLGEGILSSSGLMWAHQRKIIAPELYPDKVKGMVWLMVESTKTLLKSWENRIRSEKGIADIRVDDDLRSLSADIISRTCFGSSYSQGKEIFLKLRELQKVMSSSQIGVTGIRYLPTKNNRAIWKLDKEIQSMILEVVKSRSEAACEKDLLQMIIEGAKCSADIAGLSPEKYIVDNCKNIYFAGHETTATTVTWSLVLLAAHPDWQARARAEVVNVLANGPPDSDKLRRMKILTMIIQETLRLYPPAVFVIREALQDFELSKLLIPKGFNVQVPIPILHQNPEIWGADATRFNPERFAQGVSGACKLVQAYIPFGLGARSCAGQQFALVEVKVILSLILSKFSFSLSPTYQHSPAFRLVIEPGYGVGLSMQMLRKNS